MADATGHMDYPGTGVWSTRVTIHKGVQTNHYANPVQETGRIELIKANPPGIPDTLAGEFASIDDARIWLESELQAGRL